MFGTMKRLPPWLNKDFFGLLAGFALVFLPGFYGFTLSRFGIAFLFLLFFVRVQGVSGRVEKLSAQVDNLQYSLNRCMRFLREETEI